MIFDFVKKNCKHSRIHSKYIYIYKYSRPSLGKNLHNWSTNGDPILSLDTLRFSLVTPRVTLEPQKTPKFSSKIPDFHWRLPDENEKLDVLLMKIWGSRIQS